MAETFVASCMFGSEIVRTDALAFGKSAALDWFGEPIEAGSLHRAWLSSSSGSCFGSLSFNGDCFDDAQALLPTSLSKMS